MSTPDDRPRGRPGSGADLSCHRRRARSLPALQVGRGGVWTDVLQISIGRDQPNRRDIKVRGRDDAGDALRSSPGYADPHQQMVLAQGMGHEDRQAPRNEEGDRSLGTPPRRDHAPYMG